MNPNFWSLSRGDRAVAVDVDVGGHPDEHPLALARQAREVGDLDVGIQHDAPDPDAGRVAQLVGRFRVAVHDDAGRVDPAGQGDGQLTGRADVDAEALFAGPARHRGGQQRLARVDDLDIAQRLAVAPGAAAEVGLVDHVGRGAELVGDIGQRDAARRRAGRHRRNVW